MNSFHVQEGARTESSSVRKADDVLVRGNRYTIKNDGMLEAEYMTPVEGDIRLLDETDAKVSQVLTNRVSSYVRVIKEYKGESYILSGRSVGSDGKMTQSLRKTISRSTFNDSLLTSRPPNQLLLDSMAYS